jgi:glutamyl-Q tRNA(Asp) synthetase
VNYVGRFAPSPTGRLHLGSLVTATASYLEARCHGGRWLLRIEDVDTTRRVPGASEQILQTLGAFGFAWDGPVLVQSERFDRYAAALGQLQRAGLCYACSCSRRQLESLHERGRYPCTCRHGAAGPGPTAIRLRVDEKAVLPIDDQLLGPQSFALADYGDPIIRRRDGLYAYQLAVVVDDAESGVTAIVRGQDLLPSTGWQRALQLALRLPAPSYTHLPLVVNADGSKLAKSGHALPLDGAAAGRWLWSALLLLRQQPPPHLQTAAVSRIWEWALEHWQIETLRGLHELSLAEA